MILQEYFHPTWLAETVCEVCGASSSVEPVYDIKSSTIHSMGPAYQGPFMFCQNCLQAAMTGKRLTKMFLRGSGMCVPIEILRENLEELTTDFLCNAGMDNEFMLADPALVPRPVTKAMTSVTRESLGRLRAGLLPPTGVCLSGVTEVGKSMSIASWIVQWAQNYLRRMAPLHKMPVGEGQQNTVVTWVPWISTCFETSRSANFEAMKHLRSVPLMVLDDLGAETPTKRFGVDEGLAFLEDLIDTRDRRNLPTFTTTNLTREEIYKRYGDRFTRRLLRINQFIEVPSGPLLGRINHL